MSDRVHLLVERLNQPPCARFAQQWLRRPEHHRLAARLAEHLALLAGGQFVHTPCLRLTLAAADALRAHDLLAVEETRVLAQHAQHALDKALHRLPKQMVECFASHPHAQPRRLGLCRVAVLHLEQRLRVVGQRDEGTSTPRLDGRTERLAARDAALRRAGRHHAVVQLVLHLKLRRWRLVRPQTLHAIRTLDGQPHRHHPRVLSLVCLLLVQHAALHEHLDHAGVVVTAQLGHRPPQEREQRLAHLAPLHERLDRPEQRLHVATAADPEKLDHLRLRLLGAQRVLNQRLEHLGRKRRVEEDEVRRHEQLALVAHQLHHVGQHVLCRRVQCYRLAHARPALAHLAECHVDAPACAVCLWLRATAVLGGGVTAALWRSVDGTQGTAHRDDRVAPVALGARHRHRRLPGAR